jgi:hypothetical protein
MIVYPGASVFDSRGSAEQYIQEQYANAVITGVGSPSLSTFYLLQRAEYVEPRNLPQFPPWNVGPSGPPASVSITSPSAGVIDISWTPPVYDGGGPINNYFLTLAVVNSNGTNEATQAAPVGYYGQPLTYQFTGLTSGSNYQVFVQAVNVTSIPSSSAVSNKQVVS